MRAMVINTQDNVQLWSSHVASGGAVEAGGETITANNDIRQGHKSPAKTLPKAKPSSNTTRSSAWLPPTSKGRPGSTLTMYLTTPAVDDERMAKFDKEGSTYLYSSAPSKHPRQFSAIPSWGIPAKRAVWHPQPGGGHLHHPVR